MNHKVRIAIALVMALVLCAAMAATAFAHAIVVEAMGGTIVKFAYSDGTVASGAKILVYDAGGEAIAKGKVDKEGLFDYAEYVGTAASLYMNDGEGHAITYEIPAEEAPAESAAEPTTEPTAEPAAEATVEPAAEPETEKSKAVSGSTIAVIAIIVAAAALIAVLIAKRGKK